MAVGRNNAIYLSSVAREHSEEMGGFLAYSLGMCKAMKGKLNFVTKIEWRTLVESLVGGLNN